MRAVVQRVSRAKVTVKGPDNDEITGEIALGLLTLLGVGANDTRAEADYLAEKIIGLRIFEDPGGKMNLAVGEVKGADKTARAKAVGGLIATRAKEAGVDAAVFDRGGRLYHGRVAALADGAREGGLQI